MSAEKKYPIAATCNTCKKDVWVNLGKDSGEEYLTNTKNIRGKKPDFHGCYKASWKPRVLHSASSEEFGNGAPIDDYDFVDPRDEPEIPSQKAPAETPQQQTEEAAEGVKKTFQQPEAFGHTQVELEEFETADARMDFDRTHKLVELSISKTRKVNEKTIPQIHQYESLDYFINAKIECEINANFQKIVREKFADISVAIAKEIEQDRLRLEGLKKK